MLSDIQGLLGAFNSLNLGEMVQMLYGDAQQIEQLCKLGRKSRKAL